MNRRDFLTLRIDGSPAGGVLSCERLYMRYLDSQTDGTTAELFANLAQELRRVKTLRLTEPSWLACGDLKNRVIAALEAAGLADTAISRDRSAMGTAVFPEHP